MIKAEIIYSPQNYVEAVTGKCYVFKNENTCMEIEKRLEENGFKHLWSFPFTEIDHIVENGLDVVLVSVAGFNEKGQWEERYRWFEVPDGFNVK